MADKGGERITIYHATAPTCWWSWGYEAVLNRVRLVYGDQVDVRLLTGCVHEDFEEWLKRYEMTWDEYLEWQTEAAETVGVPVLKLSRRDQIPRNVMPASLAALAASVQSAAQGERFFRALLRRSVVEGLDVSSEAVILEAAQEAGLDHGRFRRDLADTDARRRDMEHQGHGFPHLPLGFYNLAITDGGNRSVILDHAYDPREVEEAIDFLSRGTLRKAAPSDFLGYLVEHGPAPALEIARAMAVSLDDAAARLGELEREGRVERVTLPAGVLWSATGDR